MTTIQTDSFLDLTARQVMAAALSVALADPLGKQHGRQFHPQDLQLLEQLWRVAGESSAALTKADLGLGELPPAEVDISPLVVWLRCGAPQRALIHQQVFGLVISKHCPPYETEFCHWKDPTYRAHQLADIAGFYCAFGLAPDQAHPERHDHVALELEFIVFLLQKLRLALVETPGSQHVEICRHALSRFVTDHIAWWIPTFGKCLETRIDQVMSEALDDDQRIMFSAFKGVAVILRAWAAWERIANGIAPSRQIIAPQVDSQPTLGEDDACGSCVESCNHPVD